MGARGAGHKPWTLANCSGAHLTLLCSREGREVVEVCDGGAGGRGGESGET